MKVLIISDTHGVASNLDKVLRKEGMPDFLIHAGDTGNREDDIISRITCPYKMIYGNNDYREGVLKDRELFELEGHMIYLTHGHREGAYYGIEGLVGNAASLGADIVVYGHTHVPNVEKDEELGVYAVNPGSLTYPRQQGFKDSYIIMEINDKDEPEFEVNFL